MSGSLNINRDINEDAMGLLVDNGLDKRFPQECSSWLDRKKSLDSTLSETTQRKEAEVLEKLRSDFERLDSSLRFAILDKVLDKFPYLSLTLSIAFMLIHLQDARSR
jgi:hypothetical protein